MPRKSRFKVTCVTYRSGSTAYRVSGTLHGKQVRKNFKTRKEAFAERQRLDLQRLNAPSGGCFQWVDLSPEALDDAVAAAKRIRSTGKPLAFVVDYFLENYQEVEFEKPLAAAVEEYVDLKSKEEAVGLISPRQSRGIRLELQRFRDHFDDRHVSELTRDRIEKYLGVGNSSLKTWNNRRGYLSTFFKFCEDRKFVSKNPVTNIPHHRIGKQRASPETLSAAQVSDMMGFLEAYSGPERKSGQPPGVIGAMVPYFALCLFAGIRPDWKDGEIRKLRTESIQIDTGTIHIEPRVSKNTEKRSVKIQPNLAIWLKKYPPENFPIIPASLFREMRLEIRKRFNLGHDVLRHTYVSMLVGAFRSVGDAALQAGNSEGVIRRYYLDLKSEEEAERFWRICPQGTTLPKNLQKQNGRYVIPQDRDNSDGQPTVEIRAPSA